METNKIRKKNQHRLDITELDSKIQHRQQQANRKSQRLHTTYISCYVISLDTSSVKIFHDMSVQEAIFWEATSHVVKSKLTSKKLFYYEITVRDPKTNSISMPLASMVSSAHIQSAILFWLTLFRNHEKQIYGIDKLS